MKISQSCRQHLKDYESLRLKAYDDAQPNKNITSVSQVKGKLTIGYGHTSTAKVGMVITKAQAEALFESDVAQKEKATARLIKVDVNQNMFDALVHWIYNLGENKVKNSTAIQRLNAGDYQGVPEAIKMWSGGGGGIIIRRKFEAELFIRDFGVLPNINPSAKNIGNDVVALVGAGLALAFLS